MRHRAFRNVGFVLLLALCAGYILFNESFANWQSVLVCAELLCLAVTLARVRGAPG